MLFGFRRAISLVLCVFGAILNVAVASQLISLWRLLKWETDTEWEGVVGSWGIGNWGIDAVNVVWALVSAYFATAAVACVVGAFGIVRRLPAYVRFYRDYSIADLCFCALTTITFALASFRPNMRTTVCDQLAKQPELLRDVAEAGLNLENCEQWFEHAVIAFVGVTAILLVVRLQFIITVSNYYKRLLRDRPYTSLELSSSQSPSSSMEDLSADMDSRSPQPQRLFLLPNRESVIAPSSQSQNQYRPADKSSSRNDVLIYAPVPFSSLTEADAKQLEAREAWVSMRPPMTPHHRRYESHHHVHSHHHGHHNHSHHRSHIRRHSLHSGYASSSFYLSDSADDTDLGQGGIRLPIRENEGMLPPYANESRDIDLESGINEA